MSRTDAQKKTIIEDLTRDYSLAKNTHQTPAYIIRKTVARNDILARLATVDEGPLWYWKSRDGGIEIGGSGLAISLRELTDFNYGSGHDPVIFGGGRFSDTGTKDGLWEKFPGRIYTMPRRMFMREQDKFLDAACLIINESICMKSLIAEAEDFFDESPASSPPAMEFKLPLLLSKKHNPDFEEWRRRVEKGLAAIAFGSLEKIVLARCTEYKFKQTIDHLSLLRRLMELNPRSYAFMYQPKPGTTFISVTPERLYRRSHGRLEIDALSSTVPRGLTPQEDLGWETKLLDDSKLRREHQLVIDGILDAITPLVCEQPAVGRTSVLKLDRIQHLMTPITGQLRDGIGDSEILESLHPTPAVGGTPRHRACNMIRELETIDRGWYAGPIGLITGCQAEFAVGIRSLLVSNGTVSVFAGAGIVAGSDPENEWREIDSKNILGTLLIEQEAF